MKLLDKILYKRLERIREELNFYIADKSERKRKWQQYEESVSDTAPMVCQENYSRVMGRFLNVMSLEEDVSGFEFEADSRKKGIDAVLEKKAETFSTMLLRLIDEKGLKDSVVYKNANIDRRLFSKIRGDEDYVPSKKTAISFCLALQLTMEEAKKLLETAGYALSTASRFDLIIMYLIENKEYNIHFANIVLEDYGEGTLSK